MSFSFGWIIHEGSTWLAGLGGRYPGHPYSFAGQGVCEPGGPGTTIIPTVEFPSKNQKRRMAMRILYMFSAVRIAGFCVIVVRFCRFHGSLAFSATILSLLQFRDRLH